MEDKHSGCFWFLMLLLGAGAVYIVLQKGFSGLGKLLLIAAIVIGLLILLAVVLVLVIVFRKPKDKKQKAGEEEPMIILAKGRSNLVELRRLTMRIRDDVIRHTAEQICEKVDNILRVLKEQPEDIPTVRQFFNYHLPTLGNVLLKFIHLESNGILDQDIFSKTLACLTDINAAMDKQYENLFADDVLDLTVEMQVLSTMCRQDGLLDSEDFVLHDGSRDIQLTL